ncbi:LPS export ABC transporter ATP-binding protein [Zavarzinia sp. CC-PAN008]|uniref:LPS export ABC transporter ATP-binding protein n=1 Tax=Zavarzinia sp. CC-PAN008 TaxID=3243332 RepID=UPI003F746C30
MRERKPTRDEGRADGAEGAAGTSLPVTAGPVAAGPAATGAAADAPHTGPRLIADNPGLEVKAIGKNFRKRPVVRGVSMTVQRGEVVGLLGPNGAGKTTCFYLITGLMQPDYGTIALDGRDLTDLPMYRRARLGIGYLPQEASIFRGLSVENNIRAILEVVEPIRDKREAMLDDLLAEFSITHLRRTPAIALSGGERRRVEIARALATQPSFMLLDEPLAGIDPIAINEIRTLVTHLKNRGIGVLITDHNVRDTLDLIDRAYIIHEGRVLMEGHPSDIVAHEGVRRVYLGDRFSL